MILYDYQCQKCEEEFEMMMPLSFSDETACPECRGRAIKIITRIAPFMEKENKRKWGSSFYRSTPKRGGKK